MKQRIGVPYFQAILKDEHPRPRGTDGVPYAVCPECGEHAGPDWDGRAPSRHWAANHAECFDCGATGDRQSIREHAESVHGYVPDELDAL